MTENPDNRSHITILHPRELSFGGSSRMTTDFLFNLTRNERDNWTSRKEFSLTALMFCLSLSSLWRFPKELLVNESGSFFWLYILLTFVVGNSLMFFEVALGQYSSKGFAKVFAMCPLLEGVSYAMVAYCLVVAVFYNFINVISFTYFYSSFVPELPYQHCLKNDSACVENGVNLTSSPEYEFFYHNIIFLYDKHGVIQGDPWEVNWRNFAIVFLLWVFACVAIMRGIRTARWFPKIYCSLPYIILVIVLSAAFMTKGSLRGISRMLIPSKEGLFSGNTWRRALEQSIVNLGIGMGPLITFGSLSRFQSPAHKDSFFVCCSITLVSILSGMVIFGAVGILAEETGQEIEAKLTEYRENIGIDVQLVYSQLFSRVPKGLQHLSAILFFLLHSLAGWYSLISYIEVFNYALFSTGKLNNTPHCRIKVNITLCSLFILIGFVMCTRGAHNYMEAVDKHFIGFSLIIITLFELIGVVYIYGVFDLCDDIEFMLGFYPNIYYQITWICIPIVLFLFLVYDIYGISSEKLNRPDIITCTVIVLFIICPILFRTIYNLITSYLSGISKIFYPREVILDESYDPPSALFPV